MLAPMINIVLYEHSKDFYQLDFDQFNVKCEQVFVTPSPFHADTLRAKLSTQKNSENFDVITMSKYLKDELMTLVDEDILANFKGKSELMRYLATAWKTVVPDHSVGLFKKAFTLLTDLRSFSLSQQVIETALEEYDPDIKKAVLTFHQVMEMQGIIDEHMANFLLSERLRKGDLPALYPESRIITFWGFDFMSGVQVDLLKALSIRNTIIIPFGKNAYESIQDSDWIKWIGEHDTEIVKLPAQELQIQAKIVEFPKNYLSRVAPTYIKNNQQDVYLATKTLDLISLQEMNLGNKTFKVSTNIFHDSKSKLFEYLQSYLDSHDGALDTENLFQEISKLRNEHIKLQDFRMVKVLSQFNSILKDWKDLSEQNQTFGQFDYYVFQETMELDLPRVSVIPINKVSNGKIGSLKELAALDNSKENILCITSEYGSVKSSGGQYTEKVESYLISIGPIRRAELEFEILKQRIMELLDLDSTIVLIEKGLIDHDIGWNSIFATKKDEVQAAKLNVKGGSNKELLELAPYDLESLSATRLQSYLDCPRKFYLNYVAKYNPKLEVPGVLDLLKLGQLEHEIIEQYVSKNNEFDETSFLTTIEESLEKLLSDPELLHARERKEEYLIELRSLCAPAIRDLIQLKNNFGLTMSFEHGILIDQKPKTTGSIDLFAYNDKMQMIIDFKRGAGSIPSQKGLLEYKKIQLWFYLKRLEQLEVLDPGKQLVFGYMNLSAPDDSLIMCSQDLTKELLKESGIKSFKKAALIKEEFPDLLAAYEEIEKASVGKIQEDKLFAPNPSEAKICQYCSVSNICPREATNA
jgi:CRISPR/Cas system-associated exonuclease Cas4 (RecB family)